MKLGLNISISNPHNVVVDKEITAPYVGPVTRTSPTGSQNIPNGTLVTFEIADADFGNDPNAVVIWYADVSDFFAEIEIHFPATYPTKKSVTIDTAGITGLCYISAYVTNSFEGETTAISTQVAIINLL